MSTTWYLGPYGDLRALECPATDLTAPVVRYGGIHQGLSGARTVDVTGYKQEYNLELEWLSESQHQWLKALHTRIVPGPLYLISPLTKNRMTLDSSAVRIGSLTSPGVYALQGVSTPMVDYPTGVLGAVCLQNSGYGASQSIKFDAARPAPVVGTQQMTFSVYLKALSAQSATLRLNAYKLDGTTTTTPSTTVPITTSWQRFWISGFMAADAVKVVPELLFNLGGTYPTLKIAAPQLELAGSPTDWDMGPGSPRVVIDQMPVTSPRHSLYHVSLTLLEA